MRCTIGLFTAALLWSTTLPAADEQIEQVLVTASRQAEDGSKLPLAWTGIDAKDLQLISHTHINEAMQQVPGTWIARGNGQESLIALRSPVLTGAGSCGAFLVAGDSISLRAPGFCNVNQLFDANTEQAGRIEVIRGPATALYGSNAMHGVINVLSAAPPAAEDQNLALEAGPWDYYRAKYRFGNTWGAHGVSARVNGTTDGGYLDDAGYDQQKATLRYDYAGNVWQVSNVLDVANLNQETAGYLQEGYKAYEDEAVKRNNPNPEAYRDAWSLRLHSKASRSLGDQHTLVITPYLRDNDMKFLMHFVPWQPVEKNDHNSLGLRTSVVSDLSFGTWANGIELEYTEGHLREYQEKDFSPNQPAGIHYDYEVDASLAAAYSQLRSALGDNWELIGGVRVEYSYYDYDNRICDGPACEPGASACRFYRPADRNDDFTDWTVNAGASYNIGSDDIVYLRAPRRETRGPGALFYRLFYYILRHYSDLKVDEKAHDTRLISRRALNSMLRLRENLRYMKAIYAMIGYRTEALPVDEPLHRDRDRFSDQFRTSLLAITSYTSFLRTLLLWIFLFSLFFLGLVVFNAVKVKLTNVDLLGNYHQTVSGWTFLVVLISIFFAITCLNLYIMSIYLSNIYNEIKQRPLYIIESVKRF